jgi:hypothetical protein
MRLVDRLPGGNSRAVFFQAKDKAQVHSDQMVLIIVRQEAGPVAWWPQDAHMRVGKPP